MESSESQEGATDGVPRDAPQLLCLDLSSDARNHLKRINKKQKILQEPLPTTEIARISRRIGYDGAVKQVQKWGSVIKENRKAKQVFPLSSVSVAVRNNAPIGRIPKPETTLEKEVAQVLAAEHQFIPDKKQMSAVETQIQKDLTLQEARLLRAKTRREKALLAHYSAKMRRQNKIKSKSFRRIARKTKEENREKFMRENRDNPESYKAWLRKEEEKRIEERFTLKHRGTSRTMSKRVRFSKYNEESRVAVQDMLDKNKQLTKKVTFADDSESDDDYYKVQEGGGSGEDVDENTDMEDAEDLSIASVNCLTEKKMEDADEIEEEEVSVAPVEVTSRKRTLEDLDDMSDVVEDGETVEGVDLGKRNEVETGKTGKKGKSEKKKRRKVTKEPEPKLEVVSLMGYDRELGGSTSGPDLVDEDEGGNLMSQMIESNSMSESHGVANNVREFEQEKKEIAERDRPKNIDLTLPGWGEWAGVGLKMSNKKKRRHIIKVPDIPRKDRALPNVIISETKDSAIANHQVSSLPHPYRNVDDFQRKLNKTIGKNLNSASNYYKNISPQVITRLGAVITPIPASAANKSTHFRKFERKC